MVVSQLAWPFHSLNRQAPANPSYGGIDESVNPRIAALLWMVGLFIKHLWPSWWGIKITTWNLGMQLIPTFSRFWLCTSPDRVGRFIPSLHLVGWWPWNPKPMSNIVQSPEETWRNPLVVHYGTMVWTGHHHLTIWYHLVHPESPTIRGLRDNLERRARSSPSSRRSHGHGTGWKFHRFDMEKFWTSMGRRYRYIYITY